jgi:malate/lactate dehydrogenase
MCRACTHVPGRNDAYTSQLTPKYNSLLSLSLRQVCGVTTLDVCRANTFVAANQGMDPTALDVTVIGGHAGITILPLLSQIPGAKFSDADREALTVRIQFGGDEVVKAKVRR